MKNIIVLDAVTSTNDYAKKHFHQLKNKTVITAGEQTAGRGRYQRTWHSPKGEALYCSIVLKTFLKINELPYLNLISSLSVLKTIQQHSSLIPQLKWPNDVYINKKKVAGILIDSFFKMNTLEGAITGLGININNKIFPGDLQLKATSIYLETRNELNIEVFLKDLIRTFFTYLRKRRTTSALIKEWTSYSPTLQNTPVMIAMEGTLVKGYTNGLSANGYLQVKKENGTCLELTTSDIFFSD